MTRLFLLTALAAAVAGCAADGSFYYTAEQCWGDKACRREWREADAAELRKRTHHRSRYLEPVVHKRKGDRDLPPIRTAGAPICHSLVVATGDRAQSEEAAQNKALTSWQNQVQFKYGEAYTAFHNAQRPQILCTPAGLADTVTGKFQQKWLGITHWRCELSGYPCRQRPEAVHRDE